MKVLSLILNLKALDPRISMVLSTTGGLCWLDLSQGRATQGHPQSCPLLCFIGCVLRAIVWGPECSGADFQLSPKTVCEKKTGATTMFLFWAVNEQCLVYLRYLAKNEANYWFYWIRESCFFIVWQWAGECRWLIVCGNLSYLNRGSLELLHSHRRVFPWLLSLARWAALVRNLCVSSTSCPISWLNHR